MIFLSRQFESSCYDFFVMVLLSKIIMVLSTLITLSQSSPRRISSKRKHLKHGTVSDSILQQPISHRYSSIDDKSFPNPRLSETNPRLYNTNPGLSDINPRLSESNPSSSNWGGHEHLCETNTRTVHLNTDMEEYNPPFYISIKCRNPHDTGSMSNVQKCAFNLLHCVQTYTTMYFSRRKSGEDCWQPYSLEIPSGCECMWPVEEFGPLSKRDDL